MIGTALALFLLLASLAAAFGMSRRWGWCSTFRRPRPRHWVTRLICGALGAASIVLVAVGTIHDARGFSGDPERFKLLVPTLPPPEAPSDRGELRKGRFLLHAVLFYWKGGSMVPLHCETSEVQWPRDRDRVFQSAIQSGATSVAYSIKLSRFHRNQETPDWTEGIYKVEARGFSSSSGSGGGTDFPIVQPVSHLGEGRSMFNVVRPLSDAGAILFDLTPVREEDVLKWGSLDDFLALRGSTTWRSKLNREIFWEDGRRVQGSPAAALILNLGGISVLLLGTAIILSHLFRRRSLGFVKVAACLILYVGALDRLALRIHESRVRDESAPVERRLGACAQLPATMFFRDTAQRDLEAVAADPSAPRPLKDLAARLAERER